MQQECYNLIWSVHPCCTPFFSIFITIFQVFLMQTLWVQKVKIIKKNKTIIALIRNGTKCIPVANKWNEAHQLISLKRRLICNDKWNFTSNCFAGRQHIFIQQTMTNALSSRNCMPIWFCCYVLCAFNVVDFFFNCFLISLDWFVTPFQNINASVPSVSIYPNNCGVEKERERISIVPISFVLTFWLVMLKSSFNKSESVITCTTDIRLALITEFERVCNLFAL